jgi:hypothetical protein
VPVCLEIAQLLVPSQFSIHATQHSGNIDSF